MNQEELKLEAQILKKINARSQYIFKNISDSDLSNNYMVNSPLQAALYLVSIGQIDSLEEKEYIFAATHLQLYDKINPYKFDRVESVLQALGGLNPKVFQNITVEFLEILNKKKDNKSFWNQFFYMTVAHQESLPHDLWSWLANNCLKTSKLEQPIEKQKNIIKTMIYKKMQFLAGANNQRIMKNVEKNLSIINSILEKQSLDKSVSSSLTPANPPSIKSSIKSKI